MISALVYDIEILNAIPDNRHPPVEGVSYCGGWDDYKGMGIACICTYDYKHDRYHTFLEDNQHQFFALLQKRDYLIGFNNGGFDDKLIMEVVGFDVNKHTKSMDLLSEVWAACGLGRRYGGPQYAGFGLQELSLANGLPGKTSTGAHAPILWQKGKRGEVIDYCLNDVWLTKKLIDQCREVGHLQSPKNALPMEISAFARL